MKCCRREKLDWSSCGHSNRQRCRRSNKQKQQECSLCRGAARSLLLLMPTSSASHLLRFPPFLPPSLQPLLASWLTIWAGWRSEEEAPAGSFFFFFFPSGPERRKRGANGGELIFQNGAYLFVLFSTHACPLSPSLDSPTFISITPAIMTWRRGQSERQHFATFLPRLKKNKIGALRLAQVRAKVSSQMCTGDLCFWVKVLPLWICLKTELRVVRSGPMTNDSLDILLNLFLVLSVMVFFNVLFLWILNDVFINWKR